MRCFFLLLFLALPATAIAADSAPDQSTTIASRPTSSCGTKIADALSQARASLAKKDTGSERNALECLIEAVAKLEAEMHAVLPAESGDGLAIPKTTVPFPER